MATDAPLQFFHAVGLQETDGWIEDRRRASPYRADPLAAPNPRLLLNLLCRRRCSVVAPSPLASRLRRSIAARPLS